MSQRHPREGAKALRQDLERRLGRPVSRREFLRASAGAAVAVPTLSALLAACGGNPRTQVQSGFKVATPDDPVTLPIVGKPIADGLQAETGATLQIYNWDQYIWKPVIDDFCKKYKCGYELNTFNNMEEGIAKLQTGELKVDVFFPTYDYMGKLVHGGFLQPLNHTYIPNLKANVWDYLQNPFYDQGSQYSVPYAVYTTGISYRRDHISDDEIFGADNPRALLWDPKYDQKVGVYDSYRDTIAFALQEQGINDVNTEKSADIDKAKAALLDLIDKVSVRATINGSYAKLPKGEYWLHESWSGDIVAGWSYTPHATEAEYETLGYWFPEDRVGPADNDTLAIPTTSPSPVLAHLFLNHMLEYQVAMDNFSWNGYQPPQRQADVSSLTTTEGLYSKDAAWAAPATYVPAWMPAAVVRESDLSTTGLRLHELSPAGDQLWSDAWQEFKAGA